MEPIPFAESNSYLAPPEGMPDCTGLPTWQGGDLGR